MTTNNELITKAKSCGSCTDWLSVCNAECCKTFRALKNKVTIKENLIIINCGKQSSDLQWYCELRGFKYLRSGKIYSQNRNVEVVDKGIFLEINRPCSALKDNLCTLHNTYKKPLICQGFNELTGEYYGQGKAYATPNCLCKFKNDEGIKE